MPSTPPLPLPHRRRRRHHRLHDPVQYVNASAGHRRKGITNRIEILHTSILFCFPINAIIVVILFVI